MLRLQPYKRFGMAGFFCLTYLLVTFDFVVGGDLQLEAIPAGQSGLNFTFYDGSRGRFDLPEIMGGGMAVADFDNDKLPDIFFCQGGPIADQRAAGADIAAKRDDPPSVWYRNVGVLKFERVAVQSGDAPSYAMGAWPCDFDRDGRVDLFVTGWRGWKLLKNQGNWTFQDVSDRLGPSVAEWSTAAIWADFNADGHWDLFIGGYVKYNPDDSPFCAAPDGNRDYCGPEDFEAVPDRLFYGDGHGTFQEVTGKVRLNPKIHRALGAIAYDFNRDKKLDLFVANDGSPNLLYIQQADGSFMDQALACGVALQADGEPLAGMGVALAVLKRGESPSLFVTNFHGRGTVVFESLRPALFVDRSEQSRLKTLTRGVNGFGIAVTDLNHDGHLELIQANGHVLSRERLGTPLRMPMTIISRNDQGVFQPVKWGADSIANQKMIGRGLIVADLDQDGDEEILVSRLDGPPVLLRNDAPRRQSDESRRTGDTAHRPIDQDQPMPVYFGGSYLSGVVPDHARQSGIK